MVSERAAKIVRLVLAILSVAGWVVFIVGFSLAYANLEKMYKDMMGRLEMFRAAVLYPMWVFGVAAIPTYIALFVHILGRGKNWGHALHAILMFFNFFYLTSGGTSIFACMGFIAIEHSKSISGLFTYPMRDLYIMITGSTFSVVLYWVSTTIWPLFHIKRQRHSEYQELLDHSGSTPHRPPLHTEYYTYTYAK